MSSKKINRTNWFEIFGYGLAIAICIGWGLSGIINLPKPQEQVAPQNTKSDY